MHSLENLPRLLVVAVAWDQVHRLLNVGIGHEFRVIQSCRPTQVGLLRPDDDDTAVEHRSPPRGSLRQIVSRRRGPARKLILALASSAPLDSPRIATPGGLRAIKPPRILIAFGIVLVLLGQLGKGTVFREAVF